jgi:hypothetical protein
MVLLRTALKVTALGMVPDMAQDLVTVEDEVADLDADLEPDQLDQASKLGEEAGDLEEADAVVEEGDGEIE